MPQSCVVYLSGVVRVSGCALEVVKDGLEEWELGREFGEFGGDAVDDVGDGSAVGVNGSVLLLW